MNLSGMTGSFLADIRIVLTRPVNQSQSLKTKFEAEGAKVLLFPLITIYAAPITISFKVIQEMDWIVLTSANAVREFAVWLNQLGKNYLSLRNSRFAVIGPATGKALAEYGITAALMPKQYVADALAEALVHYVSNPQGLRVLLPQSDKARPSLADTLQKHGMVVTALPCYRTEAYTPNPQEIVRLIEFDPEIIVFFSPSAVEGFCQAHLKTILSGEASVVYASFGPVTTSALKSADLLPIIESVHQNEDNLIDRIKRFARDKLWDYPVENEP